MPKTKKGLELSSTFGVGSIDIQYLEFFCKEDLSFLSKGTFKIVMPSVYSYNGPPWDMAELRVGKSFGS